MIEKLNVTFLHQTTKMCGKLHIFTHKPVENSVETVENIVKSRFLLKYKRLFLWKTFYI